MSNLYQLQAKIHELIPKINEKYGLGIRVKYTRIMAYNKLADVTTDMDINFADYLALEGQVVKYKPLIQTPQIRQILIGLKDVLGENTELTNKKKLIKIYNEEVLSKSVDYINRPNLFLENFILYNTEYTRAESLPQSQAQALCQKWLDGLNPLFDREPEKVYQELIEILENLLK